jgi:hypothetical protein
MDKESCLDMRKGRSVERPLTRPTNRIAGPTASLDILHRRDDGFDVRAAARLRRRRSAAHIFSTFSLWRRMLSKPFE